MATSRLWVTRVFPRAQISMFLVYWSLHVQRLIISCVYLGQSSTILMSFTLSLTSYLIKIVLLPIFLLLRY